MGATLGLLLSALLPSSPGCPIPVLDGKAPLRDWVHLPVATVAFQPWLMRRAAG